MLQLNIEENNKPLINKSKYKKPILYTAAIISSIISLVSLSFGAYELYFNINNFNTVTNNDVITNTVSNTISDIIINTISDIITNTQNLLNNSSSYNYLQ